jgi:hypothetical protein
VGLLLGLLGLCVVLVGVVVGCLGAPGGGLDGVCGAAVDVFVAVVRGPGDGDQAHVDRGSEQVDGGEVAGTFAVGAGLQDAGGQVGGGAAFDPGQQVVLTQPGQVPGNGASRQAGAFGQDRPGRAGGEGLPVGVQGDDAGDAQDVVLGVGAQQGIAGGVDDVGHPPDLGAGPG